MYLDHWTPYEYNVLCAYESYYDKAIDELENMGREGKMMLAALLRRKDKFEEIYKDMLVDQADSTIYED